MKKLYFAELVASIVTIGVFTLVFYLSNVEAAIAVIAAVAIATTFTFAVTATTAAEGVTAFVTITAFVAITVFSTMSTGVATPTVVGIAAAVAAFIAAFAVARELKIKKSTVVISLLMEVGLINLSFWLVTVFI